MSSYGDAGGVVWLAGDKAVDARLAGDEVVDARLAEDTRVYVLGGGVRAAWQRLRPCLDTPKNSKLYRILRHIESCGTCIKY